ncbi:MAG: YtxH domain-containing protein [Alistipes sp.]
MKNTGIVIVSLVGGLIVGSALTMLFTPHSGPEMRRHIKNFIDEEIEKVRCKCEDTDPCSCND